MPIITYRSENLSEEEKPDYSESEVQTGIKLKSLIIYYFLAYTAVENAYKELSTLPRT